MIKLFSKNKKDEKETIPKKDTKKVNFIHKKSLMKIERRKQIRKTRLRGGVTRNTKVNKDDILRIIQRPRITEKAARLSENGVYVFSVSNRSTKASIKEAVEMLYKVKPIKVSIARTHSKPKTVRGQRIRVQVGGVKKAYVYLKKGETIQLT